VRWAAETVASDRAPPHVGEGIPLHVPGAGDPPGPERIGGKAHHLAHLARLGHRVPRWVALEAGAFERAVLDPVGVPRTGTALSAQREAVLALEPPTGLLGAVERALAQAGVHGPLAVRSSAAAEDGAAASFAGQFESVLGVPAQPRDLWEAIRRVWASAYLPHAAAYLDSAAAAAAGGSGPRMAVVLQEMLDPAAAGVAFSADPVSGARDVAVVSAVFGVGEGLVSGVLDADTFRVSASGAISERTIAAKLAAVRLTGGGTELRPLAEDERARACISDAEASSIASISRQLETALGAPQDVEWALVAAPSGERTLHLLQTRPVTALGPRTGGERRIWDNSNIVESYGGVTTPLTFSFARRVYEDVYRQFCALMGVPAAQVEENRAVFANLLGLVRGRVYYNLLNWYRTLGLLPGFRMNRGFMERMMGVRERLEDPPPPARAATRVADAARLLRMLGRMTSEHRKLSRRVPAFHARVERALAPLARQDLGARSPDDLLSLYRSLEAELLHHWRPPLVNDFFAMIWFGALGRLTESWIPDGPATLVNDLLCGQGGIVSTEPARRVMALADAVAADPRLTEWFEAEPDDDALWDRLRNDPAVGSFREAIDGYLARFGDRCMNELKLETVTLSENPGFLLRTIRMYVREGRVDPAEAHAREQDVRNRAERLVRNHLRGPRATAYRAVLHRTRERVRDRENLRFERTRVFGVVRRIFVAIGGHLAASGRLEEPRDVFHLTVEEVFGEIEGTAVTGDLRALVRQRRSEFEEYAREPAPPDRFETVGLPGLGVPRPRVATPTGGDLLTGLGCSPGVVRAPVRVVRDPASAGMLSGHILVAERTDPGWTILFPAARGILVERGSLLSHSAIVAREMALPCVVGIPALLDTLRDGEMVEMDGTAGTVRRLEPGAQ
jgi:rifampicin phosphotransferase